MADRQYFDILWAGILSKLDNTVPGQCWLWTGGKTHPGGVPYGIMRVRQPGSHTSVPMKAHRAACMVKLQTAPLPRNLNSSHLCGHSLCCNPEHLSLEPHHVNNNRIHCHGSLRCSGHGEYPNCIL